MYNSLLKQGKIQSKCFDDTIGHLLGCWEGEAPRKGFVLVTTAGHRSSQLEADQDARVVHNGEVSICQCQGQLSLQRPSC